MTFILDGEQHKLQGNVSTSLKVVSESNMTKLLSQLPSSIFSLWVQETSAPTTLYSASNSQTPTIIDPRLSELLLEYQNVFEESTELPPHGSHDHRIPLLENAKPVNIRPYKHSS